MRCPRCGSTNPESNKFCGGCGAGLTSGTAARASTAPADPATQGAERRQLTVMFCDLVGSTALSARLDPEDLREAIGTYHECVTDVVGRFGGFVAKYMGDGVLAYFGYPRAQEDDPERAVSAGLALIDAVEHLARTGAHVAGSRRDCDRPRRGRRSDRRGCRQEQAVVGETPNLAARLQAFAAPGAVLIADSTRHLVSGLFEYRDLGTVHLKGFADLVTGLAGHWR